MKKIIILSIAILILVGSVFSVGNLVIYKDTILIDSITNRNSITLQLALLAGSDPNDIYINKQTPLTLLAGYVGSTNAKTSIELMTVLLDYGADINMKDKTGNTPIHEATGVWGNKDVAQFLLDNNTNPNVLNNDNQSPLEKAIYHAKDLELIKLLLAEGAQITSENSMKLFDACLINIELCENILEVLIKKGLDTNKAAELFIMPILGPEDKRNYDENGTGYSMLMKATSTLYVHEDSQENIIMQLLNAGADIDYQNGYGDSAMHFALSLGTYNSIKLLLKQEIDLSIQNLDNKNAMHIIIENKRFDLSWKKRLINDLIEAGFNLIDFEQYVKFAEQNGNHEIAEYMQNI